jgi:hypothetical protein
MIHTTMKFIVRPAASGLQWFVGDANRLAFSLNQVTTGTRKQPDGAYAELFDEIVASTFATTSQKKFCSISQFAHHPGTRRYCSNRSSVQLLSAASLSTTFAMDLFPTHNLRGGSICR